MGLAAAAKVGPYEVVAPLGAGGMGEVYRARDSRLGRVVAIKVLPANFSSDPERLRRFEQEARAAAALSHPNLLEIHDVGTQNGSPYIVTELLEGETLRERLRPGPLSVRKATDYALQVARGLAAAHEKGIVHRDLKPENIFITRDGRVKILDFGVAKLIEPEAAHTSAPTLDTTPGVVVGTVGYMAPEQVRGQAADHRSDLFSFGAILYEMLSGKRAFKGETSADTMSSILKDDPPELTETNRNIPPALERIVRHGLEKTPEERFQSARDVAFDLESLSSISSASAAALTTSAQPWRRWLKLGTVALLAVLVVIAVIRFAGAWFRPAQLDFRRITFRNGTISAARFGADGQTLVYSAAWQSNPVEVYSSAPGNVVGQSLGVQNAELLSVSRSGDLAVLLAPRVLYAWERVGTLARVSAVGGGAKPEIDNIGSADWSPDGSALAIARYLPEQKLFRIEYPAGKVLYETQGWVSHLRFSSDGKWIAFLEHPYAGDDLGWVAAVDLKGTKKTLTGAYNSVFGLSWTPSDREIWYTVANTIFAADLSGKTRLVLRLPARMVLQDIARDGTVMIMQGINRPGLVALTPGDSTARDLTWLDWPVLQDISRDGKTILFDEDGAGGGQGGYGVYLRGTDGSPAVKLGEGGGVALSPDGQWVLASTAATPHQFVLLPRGAGEPRQITHDSIAHFNRAHFFPDGKRIIFSGQEAGHSPRTYVQDVDGGAARAITPEGTWGALLSPDAGWVVVTANKKPTLWPVAGGAPRPVTGLESGESVLGWTSDGRLFVASSDNAEWRITKLDPLSGRRERGKPIAVPPLAGFAIRELMLTPDGGTCAYRYLLQVMDLYTVKGLK